MKIKISLFQSKLYFFVFLLALFAGVGFLKVEKASAGECIYTVIATNRITTTTVPSEASCLSQCSAFPGMYRDCKYTEPQNEQERIDEVIRQQESTGATSYAEDVGGSQSPDVCGGIGSLWNAGFISLINCPLLYILRFMGILLEMSASLFNWIIQPVNMNAVIDNAAIYSAWALVRDSLNIAFILVLLFSAFATIFQVDKFSYKKILLTLVIMALLVNFSFPITRFIIDLSNVLMYHFVNSLHVGDAPSGSFFVKITQDTTLRGIINPKDGVGSNTAFLIASIVFVFIFAVTLLIIAVLFVVRTIALAILIIFSSLAFTGSIVPFLSTHASKWWDNLFKYAFFGPIMVFMLYIASSLMGYISNSNLRSSMDKITANQSISPIFIADIAFFSIPIIILWIGLGVAQSMSIEGAAAITGRGKKFMGWAGRNLGGARPIASWGFKKTGIPEGAKQSWNKNVTQRFDRAQKNREAKWASTLGDKSAGERNMKNRASEYEKNNESLSDLKEWAAKGDAAAAYALANKGKIDQKTLSEAMGSIKDEKIRDSLVGKAEETRMDVTLKYKLEMDMKKSAKDLTKQRWRNIEDVAKAEYRNLTAEGWSKQKKLKEQFTLSESNPHAAEIEAGAKDAFATLNSNAKVEALKRMNGGNSSAII